MDLLRWTATQLGRIPTQAWVAVLTPLIGGAGTVVGSEFQRQYDARLFPEINQQRILALEGMWEGYGIQKIDDEEAKARLQERHVLIHKQLPAHYYKDYDDCTFAHPIQSTHGSAPRPKEDQAGVVWFPVHLTLAVKRTSWFSHKSLEGTLEITPQKSGDEIARHPSNTYDVKGRLEPNGDYIRLDYFHADPGKKDFGTILLENNSEGKLCGQFLSYGPISRSIVNGKYVFTNKGN
jgi:hypothetical protein